MWWWFFLLLMKRVSSSSSSSSSSIASKCSTFTSRSSAATSIFVLLFDLWDSWGFFACSWSSSLSYLTPVKDSRWWVRFCKVKIKLIFIYSSENGKKFQKKNLDMTCTQEFSFKIFFLIHSRIATTTNCEFT